MRVDYTLPAIQPESLAEMQPMEGEAPRSFRDQLRTSAIQLPGAWEHRLRLDTRPFTSTYVGPPPRPQSIEISDAEAERTRWQKLLWRHSNMLDPAAYPANLSGSKQSIQAMFAMLLNLQEMADAIVSQQVAVTRG